MNYQGGTEIFSSFLSLKSAGFGLCMLKSLSSPAAFHQGDFVVILDCLSSSSSSSLFIHEILS